MEILFCISCCFYSFLFIFNHLKIYNSATILSNTFPLPLNQHKQHFETYLKPVQSKLLTRAKYYSTFVMVKFTTIKVSRPTSVHPGVLIPANASKIKPDHKFKDKQPFMPRQIIPPTLTQAYTQTLSSYTSDWKRSVSLSLLSQNKALSAAQ